MCVQHMSMSRFDCAVQQYVNPLTIIAQYCSPKMPIIKWFVMFNAIVNEVK